MKLKFVFFTLLLWGLFSKIGYSQEIDCLTKLKIRQAKAPYQINKLSKSAICKTGEKYEYNIEFEKGKDYRLTFFASSVFNNKINFKIINKNTGQLIMNLPGVRIDEVSGCALQAYFDERSNKMVHPSFDFSPNGNTQLKIIIDVEAEEEKSNYVFDTSDILASTEQKKGCITVFIQSKLAEEEGFAN